jgi:hypothetical protein
MLGLAWRPNHVLHGRLVLDEFNVGYLCPGRGRHNEEKGQDKHRDHEGKVEYIRPRGRLRQIDYHVGINAPPAERGVIVRIPHGIGNEADKKANEQNGDSRAQVTVLENCHQEPVWFHVKGNAEVPERLQEWLRKAHAQEGQQVYISYCQEQPAFAALAVVHLPEPRHQRQHGCCAWIAACPPVT